MLFSRRRCACPGTHCGARADDKTDFWACSRWARSAAYPLGSRGRAATAMLPPSRIPFGFAAPELHVRGRRRPPRKTPYSQHAKGGGWRAWMSCGWPRHPTTHPKRSHGPATGPLNTKPSKSPGPGPHQQSPSNTAPPARTAQALPRPHPPLLGPGTVSKEQPLSLALSLLREPFMWCAADRVRAQERVRWANPRGGAGDGRDRRDERPALRAQAWRRR